MASDKRPTLSDILGNGSGGFNDLWNTTEAADEFEPLPGGTYRCLVADGQALRVAGQADPLVPGQLPGHRGQVPKPKGLARPLADRGRSANHQAGFEEARH